MNEILDEIMNTWRGKKILQTDKNREDVPKPQLVGNTMISEDEPTRMIAELGTLHHHDLKSLKQACRDAAQAGADLIKIQLIKAETAWWASEGQRTRYKRLEHPMTAWREFFEEMNKELPNNPVFASLFDTSYLDLSDVMPAWKLGYKARLMPELIDKTVKSGRPVIISLGDYSEYHSRMIAKSLRDEPNVLIQYVQPEYPLRESVVRLPKFGNSYKIASYEHSEPDRWVDMYQGLSIHSSDISVLTAAFLLGAQTLEVHVQGQGAEGPDCSFALTLKQLENISKIRNFVFEL